MITKIAGNLAVTVAFIVFLVSAALLYIGVPHAESLAMGAMTGLFALMQGRSNDGK